MTNERPGHDELLSLLSELVDGTLTESQAARLGALLRDDPAAQDVYLAYMSVHAQLHLDYAAGSTPVAMPGGSSMPLPAAAAAPLPIRIDADGGDVPGAVSPPGAFPPPSSASAWPLTVAFAGGLMVAFLAWGAVALYRAFWPLEPQAGKVMTPAAAANGGAARRATRVTTGEGFAMVARLDGVVWEPAEGPNPKEEDILAEGRLVFRSGRLTLAFLNGVVLTVEGPADLDLASIERVVFRRGKVRTHVPRGAEGFVVSSPGSNVTDLGTEFGLNVGDDGKTRMMVFEGEAEAAVLGWSGSARRNRKVAAQRALEIDPPRLRLSDTEANSGSFVASPKLSVPPLALDPSYRDVVLAARPWSYWRFESMEGATVPNEVAGRPPLRAFGPVRLAGAGAGNRTAAFEPGRSDQYLLMEELWMPPYHPGYAVEFWFAPERIGLAEIAGLFLPRGGTIYEHVFQLELTSKNRESILFQRASIRFLHRWPPGAAGGDNLFSDFYVPYRWHHVVAQLSDDRMELYVNGVALPTLAVDVKRGTTACQFILGQLKPLPRGPDSWNDRPFVGQIDEVALYERPLSADEVRRHHALGAAGGGRPARALEDRRGRPGGSAPAARPHRHEHKETTPPTFGT